MDNGFFWDTVETIDRDSVCGFTLYDSSHLIWLAVFVIFAILLSLIYRQSDCDHRQAIRYSIALLLIAEELFKYCIVLHNGIDMLYYLPLQLCYICIILVIIHAFTLSNIIGNFLYLAGIAAGLSALLFPAWTELPAFANAMSIHSFTSHIIFVSYIIAMIANKEIVPSVSTIPVNVSALCLMAGAVYLFNIKFGTNYMYLIKISSGSPLAPFEALGDYRIGYAIILMALIVVLYLLPLAARKLTAR